MKKPETHEQEPVQIVQKTVNIVLVGAGPATLGLLCNAQRSNRLRDLVTRDGGIAILE